MTERTLEDIFADLNKVRSKIKELNEQKMREHTEYIRTRMMDDELRGR